MFVLVLLGMVLVAAVAGLLYVKVEDDDRDTEAREAVKKLQVEIGSLILAWGSDIKNITQLIEKKLYEQVDSLNLTWGRDMENITQVMEKKFQIQIDSLNLTWGRDMKNVTQVMENRFKELDTKLVVVEQNMNRIDVEVNSGGKVISNKITLLVSFLIVVCSRLGPVGTELKHC